MTLTVSGFPDGGQIPVKYSQAAPGVAVGEGTSPAMTWANVPTGTQSFFLHMHDMDLARNKTTDDQAHWVLWNIPATTTGLPEGVAKGSPLPDGSEQTSATGNMYRGPGAPAAGPLHHYVFELFALDTKVDVKPSADAFETRTNVIKAIQDTSSRKPSTEAYSGAHNSALPPASAQSGQRVPLLPGRGSARVSCAEPRCPQKTAEPQMGIPTRQREYAMAWR